MLISPGQNSWRKIDFQPNIGRTANMTKSVSPLNASPMCQRDFDVKVLVNVPIRVQKTRWETEALAESYSEAPVEVNVLLNVLLHVQEARQEPRSPRSPIEPTSDQIVQLIDGAHDIAA